MKVKKNSKLTRAFANLLFAICYLPFATSSLMLPKRRKCFVLFPISVSSLNVRLSYVDLTLLCFATTAARMYIRTSCVCMCMFVMGTSVSARLFPICHKSNSNIYRRNYTPTDEQRDSLFNFLFFLLLLRIRCIYFYLYFYLYILIKCAVRLIVYY